MHARHEVTARRATRSRIRDALPTSRRRPSTRTSPLMYRDTETLQANLRKSKPVQDALHNDDELGEFTAILAQ